MEFFKSHGKLNNLNGRLSIESTFADLDKGTIQSIMIGYSAASNDFLLETVAAKEVYDPVIEKMVIVPITMDFTIGQNKELYKYEMSIIMNQELVIEIQGEISASDGSVKVVSKRYKNYGGGTGEVYVEKYGSYINKIDPDYITPEVQDEMHDIIQSVSVELVNTFVTESKKIFDEKAPGLSLEFFGLK